MKAAIYARVSTDQQSAALQIDALREFCGRRSWEVAGEFVDLAESGSKTSRPELDRLMREARTGAFGVVLVWKFDRFARSVIHLLHALETFRSRGVEFVSLTEGIDTSTPIGKLAFSIIGAIAEFERELIRERVKAGLDAARTNGTRSGRAIGRPRREIKPGALKSAAALRLKGRSWKEIAYLLDLPASTIRKALQKPYPQNAREKA